MEAVTGLSRDVSSPLASEFGHSQIGTGRHRLVPNSVTLLSNAVSNNDLWDEIRTSVTPIHILHGKDHSEKYDYFQNGLVSLRSALKPVEERILYTPYAAQKISAKADVQQHWTPWREIFQNFTSSRANREESVRTINIRGDTVITSRGTRERIEWLQRVMGLTVARLADMLDVQRATIYSWIEQDIKLRTGPREALERLESRAEQWAAICQHPPGTLLRNREVNGRTLEAWLTDPSATDVELNRAMVDIAHRVEARERKISGATTKLAHSVSNELRSID